VACASPRNDWQLSIVIHARMICAGKFKNHSLIDAWIDAWIDG
jgi:hypothetical protein